MNLISCEGVAKAPSAIYPFKIKKPVKASQNGEIKKTHCKMKTVIDVRFMKSEFLTQSS